MTGKIIRPAPAEIEFRNMRFLITDQPQVRYGLRGRGLEMWWIVLSPRCSAQINLINVCGIWDLRNLEYIMMSTKW